MHRFIAKILMLLLLLLSGTVPVCAAAAPDLHSASAGLWRDVTVSSAEGAAKAGSVGPATAPNGRVLPKKYRVVALDKDKFLAQALKAPHESAKALVGAAGAAQNEAVTIAIPMPDGSVQRFAIQQTSVMAPALAAKYPEIKTWLGQGIDDRTATLTMDITPHGFHGMVLSPTMGRVFIDPYAPGLSMSYFTRDQIRSEDDRHFEEEVGRDLHEADVSKKDRAKAISAVAKTSGPQRRTYRIAVAATSSYTAYWADPARNPGGLSARAATQAAIVTAVARVSGIYRTEIAVSLELVGNNDQLIITDAASDPYAGRKLNDQNQLEVDRVIGDANYDIGHVFDQAKGGGSAGLGVVCSTGSKGKGHTGKGVPDGDAFHVDYVAHEIGHQFGGNHTFNASDAGACTYATSDNSDTRERLMAYEPGSGTTIMAYAGICSPQNLQPHSDPYFHTSSFDEIRTNLDDTSTGHAGSCGVGEATNNRPPVVDARPLVNGTRLENGFTIPAKTPFTLTGSATDPDNDAMTYSWEELDLGTSFIDLSDNTKAPFFRAWSPTTSPARTFPRLSDLLNKTTTIGENLPNATRSLTFRLTARDNRATGGGVAYGTMNFNVTTAAGPFVVTAPAANANWAIASNQNITWNVAGTNVAPVNCANVDITLSTDGGNTFATTLASGVSNTGSYQVTSVPNTPSFAARVKVACSNNVFFNVSDGFQIGATTLISDGFESADWTSETLSGTTATWTFLASGLHPAGVAPHGGVKLANFNSYDASLGRQARLSQPSNTNIPPSTRSARLTFWMYHYKKSYTGDNVGPDTVQVQISTDSGVSWTNVGNLYARDDGTTGWAMHTVDLSAYVGQSIRLGFLGTSGYSYDVYLDDVSLVTIPKTPPGAPTIGSATALNASLSLSFTAPTDNGGAAIDNCRASCTGGGSPVTATGSGSPITVSGLTNGTSYRCTVAAHNAVDWGAESAASNAVTPTAGSAATAPGAPTIGTATAGNGTLSVTFTAPGNAGTLANGSAATLTGYTATCIAGGASVSGTGTASPVAVTGLTNGTAYTCTVVATNSATLNGPPSNPSNSATPSAATPPGAPTIGTATPGVGSLSVAFTEPSHRGSLIDGTAATITRYDVSCSPAGTASGTTSPIVVTGLSSSTAYTCTVTATSSGNLTSPASSSATATPTPGPLNIDDSVAPDVYSAATDGVILLRYLFGVRGDALIAGIAATSPKRNAAQIELHISSNLARFDVDGDNATLPLTDGLLILRRLLGLDGPALISGARNSSLTSDAIRNAIDALKP